MQGEIDYRPGPGRRAALAGEEAAAAGALPEGMSRWQLVACLRGAAPALGLSAGMVALIELYVDLSWPQDWEAGAEPIIPVPLCEIAEALGRSERQIRNLERALAERGLIIWRDSGNRHRRGRRDRRTGHLRWAYGPSLGPLRARAAEIVALAAQARAERAEARRLRLAISALRRSLREALEEAGPQAGDLARRFAAQPVRAPAGTPIAELARRRAELVALRETLEARQGVSDTGSARRACCVRDTGHDGTTGRLPGGAADGSADPAHQMTGKPEISRRQPTDTHKDLSMNGSCSATVPARPDTGGAGPGDRPDLLGKPAWAVAGARQVNGGTGGRPGGGPGGSGPAAAGQVLKAAGPVMRALLAERRDLAGAAHAALPLLGIAQPLWAEACATLGREHAALCLIVLERAMGRQANEAHAPVRNPPGYFRALIRRGRAGRLDIPASLHGWAARAAGGAGIPRRADG